MNPIFLSGLNWTCYPYGICAAVSALLALLLMSALAHGTRQPRSVIPCFGALGILLGVIFARLLYVLVNLSIYTETFENPLLMLRLSDGGFSMAGLLMGLILAAAITARIHHCPVWDVLNLAAPAVFLLVAGLRFGESFTEMGIGKVVQKEEIAKALPFLFSQESFGVLTEYRLKVWLCEGIVDLLLCGALCCRLLSNHRKGEATRGETALLFAMLYGATQLLLESLRDDQHMTLLFVKVEQLGAALLCLMALGILLRRVNDVSRLLYWVLAILAIGGAVLVEFSLDGRVTFGRPTHLRDWLILLGMSGVLFALPCLLMKRLHREKSEEMLS